MAENDEHTTDEHTTGTTVVAADAGTRPLVVSEGTTDHRPGDAHLSDAEVARLRTMLNDGSFDDGASRIKWFLLGFLAALLGLVIAAAAFLVVSDEDDDGNVRLDVPTVDVES